MTPLRFEQTKDRSRRRAWKVYRAWGDDSLGFIEWLGGAFNQYVFSARGYQPTFSADDLLAIAAFIKEQT